MHDEMNLETDRFKLIFTTSVVSAQIWAINMAANGNGNVEIGTDRFRSIFTMCVNSKGPNMGNGHSKS